MANIEDMTVHTYNNQAPTVKPLCTFGTEAMPSCVHVRACSCMLVYPKSARVCKVDLSQQATC